MTTTLTESQIEHLACYAAERGDVDLESICDIALSGDSFANACLVDIVENDPDLVAWMAMELRERPEVAA